jgi:hypothetical protein
MESHIKGATGLRRTASRAYGIPRRGSNQTPVSATSGAVVPPVTRPAALDGRASAHMSAEQVPASGPLRAPLFRPRHRLQPPYNASQRRREQSALSNSSLELQLGSQPAQKRKKRKNAQLKRHESLLYLRRPSRG